MILFKEDIYLKPWNCRDSIKWQSEWMATAGTPVHGTMHRSWAHGCWVLTKERRGVWYRPASHYPDDKTKTQRAESVGSGAWDPTVLLLSPGPFPPAFPQVHTIKYVLLVRMTIAVLKHGLFTLTLPLEINSAPSRKRRTGDSETTNWICHKLGNAGVNKRKELLL